MQVCGEDADLRDPHLIHLAMAAHFHRACDTPALPKSLKAR
jgi:hypothetical protein